MFKKKLIIITGPSGVGKTTVINILTKNNSNLHRLVNITTRAPRPNEINGRDYNFVTLTQFKRMIKQNDLFEYAEVYGNWYGNSRKMLDKIWTGGKAAIMTMDIQGAKKVEQTVPEALTIFLKPDTMTNLKQRILSRPMSDTDFTKRWEKVKHEIRESAFCDFRVINREKALDKTIKKLEAIIAKLVD